jgi:hypothetical protein
MFPFGRSLFGRGATVAPAPGAGAASSPAAAANAAARAAANAAAAPAAAAPVAAAPPRSWGNYLRQGTTLNTTGLKRATTARNAAQASYNAALAANTSTNAGKKTLKNTKNILRKARETYAAQLRASKKIENENTKAANAAAAELMESKGASSKFFDNVINPNGSALNRYFKRDTDFQIFDKSDMNPIYINNETKTGFREYTTGRNTNKKNNKQFYTDHKETIENYKLVGTKILPDVNIVFIRMFGVTEGNAVDNLQLYVTELRKSVDAEKKSAQVWAQRKEAAGTAGRAAYTAGLGLAAAPLAVAALPVGLAAGTLYGTGVAAKGAYNYGVKPAGQCVGAACKAVYNAATGDSQLTKLIEKVDRLIQKVDALTPGAAAAPSTVAANANASTTGLSAAAALASGATPTIDFTAVLNSVGKTDELTPKLRAALENAGVAEDKIVKVLDAASIAWNAASGGAPGARVAAATAAQAAFDAPTAGGRRPSRRNHKKHTMMTRRKKSKNKKH